MKLSLASVRQANSRQRRRRPIQQETVEHNQPEDEFFHEDKRAIKRATRLVLENCTSKASRIFDCSFQKSTLTDQEKVQKLRALHPEQNCNFKVPEDAPIIAGIAVQELRCASRRLAKGVSPGPTGTTDSIVRLLIDDEPCCNSLCHMMSDLINGFLSRQVLQRLNRARLVAIDKPNGGVRPVAIGEIFSKLAGIILLQRYEKSLEPLFAPMQQGVFSQAGCERIVHKLRDRWLDGHSILTVDMQNAFNSPSREEIAKCVFAFATLKPFQRFFAAEYSNASELLFYGSDGSLTDIIMISAGVRQGSALASLYFCVFCQPILETLASEFPGIEINAYIDDITLVSRDSTELEKAFFRLKGLLEEKQVKLAEAKCVWFRGKSGNSIPNSLSTQGVKSEDEAVKVLGAYIGENNTISERLLRQLEKQVTAFRRLKRMGINNISMILLAKCANVRQQYLIRVHPPETTEKASSQFDQEVENVVETWIGPLSPDQMKIVRLPVKKGGMGLAASSPLRETAYVASRYSVLERRNSFSARIDNAVPSHPSIPKNSTMKVIPVDEKASTSIHHVEVLKKLQTDPDIKPILQATSFKGNSDWILSNAKYIPSHLFKLAIMPRLNAQHPDLPTSLLCPGCGILLNNRNALTHIPGCAQCSGINTTVKHNSLVGFLHRLCVKAGIPCETEPRNFSTWKCIACRSTISPENQLVHQKTCAGKKLCRSGPDLVIYWNTGAVFYDLTVIHELSMSNRGKKCTQLMNDALQRKSNTYVRTNLIREDSFQCLPVLAGGALHRNTQNLVHSLADAAMLNRKQVELEMKLTIQELNGLGIYAQLKKYLDGCTQTQEYSI